MTPDQKLSQDEVGREIKSRNDRYEDNNSKETQAARDNARRSLPGAGKRT